MSMTRGAALVAATMAMGGGLLAQPNGRPVPRTGVIDTPGNYMLQDDRQPFSASGAAITITANDVTLDLNGYGVAGLGNKTGVGVRIMGAQGVKVTNGFIANAAFGVVVMNSSNVVISGLQIRGQGLPVVAPPPETGIMIVQSRNVVVEHNAIDNTGLGIFVRGGMSRGNRIANNTITAGTNGILGICYNPADGDANGPVGDLVYANTISGFNTGIQASATSRYNVFKENTVFFTTGMAVELQNPTNMDMNNTKIDLMP
jgi:nitrous oxidase accessory protein NosD